MDANKKVYVYNTSGGLLGSWTAGGLNRQRPGRRHRHQRHRRLDRRQQAGQGLQVHRRRQPPLRQPECRQQLQPRTAATPTPRASSPTARRSGSSTTARTDKVFKYTLAGTSARQLDHRRGQRQPDRPDDQPGQRQRHLDRRQRHATRSTSTRPPPAARRAARSPPRRFALAAGNTNPQDIADPPGHQHRRRHGRPKGADAVRLSRRAHQRVDIARLSLPKRHKTGAERRLLRHSGANNAVLRYDGSTFAYLGHSSLRQRGTSPNPSASSLPRCLVGVQRRNGCGVAATTANGSLRGVFVPRGAQGIDRPTDMLVRDDQLYIGAWGPPPDAGGPSLGDVHRYSPSTGAIHRQVRPDRCWRPHRPGRPVRPRRQLLCRRYSPPSSHSDPPI